MKIPDKAEQPIRNVLNTDGMYHVVRPLLDGKINLQNSCMPNLWPGFLSLCIITLYVSRLVDRKEASTITSFRIAKLLDVIHTSSQTTILQAV